MSALVRLPLVASIALILAQNAAGQAGRRPPNLQDLRDVTVDGTVEGMKGNVLQMKATAGHPWLVSIQPGFSKLGVSGTARADFLKPGMLVSFTATLPEDKKAEVESPLTDLAIISPSETNTPGAFEDKEKEGVYFVRGTVRSYKDGKLTVTAGRQVVAPVSADAEIKLDSTDLGLVRQGDTIKVMGKQVQQPNTSGNNMQPGTVIGQTIDIKLQETLSAATFKKKPGK
jgi:hypothetical protein